ncbi:LysR family transcriptional regulator [Uliginosibacterium sp. 31-16]|uniref:LysR family transcriptional regulator n=1 Tax=Uliginosibacterium sp. 31-16 TaxID=3068315 RepID=UPI00273F7C8E|nr:LysR family transcriptional regulator [Uliginosibacterium sp. 31-16]MDP5241172.1 LysR family transcriptional regulator [Uliginosibacterium sp. 31-16]
MSLTRIQRFLKHGSLPQLVVFEACARLGSFTRAAEELHMAQPTVSVQIRKLTETAGVALFEQIGKRMFLTEAGQALQAACGEIFRAMEQAESALDPLRGIEGGVLRLAACPAARCFGLRMLAAFVRSHPGAQIELSVGNRAQLQQRLADNTDDLYLFTQSLQGMAVVQQAVLSNPLEAWVLAGHPLLRRARVSLAQLADEAFLMREHGSATAEAVLRLFARHGLQPKVRMVLSDDEEIRQAVAAGLGVAILPRHGFGPTLDGVRGLRPLAVEGLPLPAQWNFAYPFGKRPSPVARAFMDFVRAETPSLLRQLRDPAPVMEHAEPAYA